MFVLMQRIEGANMINLSSCSLIQAVDAVMRKWKI